MRTPLICTFLAVGCGPSTPEGPTLGEVSQEIQFESVDRLGPHRFLASIRHRVQREDGRVEHTDEAIEIKWQDWDTFEYRRVVGGELQSAVVTVDSKPWSLRGKNRWEPSDDAEPYRLDLRQSWNAWDQALEPFADRVELVEEGAELFEGRAVRRYAVRLKPETEPDDQTRSKGKRRRKVHVPADRETLLSLSGRVWVDEGTAVRLQAEVSGELEQRGQRRNIELQLTRSGIGIAQDIQSPKAAKKKKRKASSSTDAPSPSPSEPPADAEPSAP